MDPVFVRGLFAVVMMVAVFIGSIYLLVSMILGAKLGYMVTGTCLFGVFTIISFIWVAISLIPIPSVGLGTALGPKGEETTWHPIEVGPHLTTIKSEFGTFDVSDYPNGNWESPKQGRHLADLKGKNNTEKEFENGKPIVEAFISDSVSPIPGKRKAVEKLVGGPIDLQPGQFFLADVKVKQTKVAGKDSLIMVSRAVPSDHLAASSLGTGVDEGVVEQYIAAIGDRLKAGDAVMTVKSAAWEATITADKPGRLLAFGLRIGDKVKPGIPYATVDVSGQQGAPEPVDVAAVRKRGSLRTESVKYLVAFSLLFALHLAGLNRMEKTKVRVPEPQTA